MRKFSLALIAIGAFLVVLAPMIRFYAYPRLAVAPANQRSVTGLEMKGATIFDIASLKEIQTDLKITVNTTGDASAPKEHPGSVTYVNSTSIKSSDGVMRSREVERMTFDARSGESTPGVDGDFISDTEGVETPVEHTGLVAKFPFDTQKKSYDFWDSSLRKSVPIKYIGTTKIEGMTVYKFNHTISPTEYGTMDVPLSLLGLEGDDTVTAQQMYSVDRTLWVEPNTGVIIKRSEAQRQTLDYDGQARVTLTDGVVEYDDATVRKNIDEYGSQGSMLALTRTTGPQIAFVVGLLSLVGGVLLGRRRQPVGGARIRELEDAHA